MMAIFMRRCRICGAEVQVPWGPETHSESDRLIRSHVEGHSFADLQSFALRQHSLGGRQET